MDSFFLLGKGAYEANRTVQNCKTPFVLTVVAMQTVRDFYLFVACLFRALSSLCFFNLKNFNETPFKYLS